jgi:ADP-ribosyl-[dinitrogen reductase] hydrolase
VSAAASTAARPSGRYSRTVPALARALAVARTAARAAADLLRGEFFRPGGPRGEPGHCPADGEAEDLIRGILDAAFPDFGVIGEERPEADRRSRDPGAHVWLVDPNDGTADFQRGLRGASVSIGLLRGGVPVLGVVLAHTAPEGGEDLLCWAEGEGPVTRNGAPIPAVAGGALARGEVVLAASSSPRRALANARAVSPATFRPMTSIAYRLALVAAGDARGAISLHRPRALDIAGGHALLRGAGAALLDETGREVRYGRDGSGRVRSCFGGAPAAAAALAASDWTAAEGGPGAPVPLVAPIPGRGVADDALLRRAQGVLLGQLAGDALGSAVEGEGAGEIARRFPAGVRDLAGGGVSGGLPGQLTDDSELALALGRALVEAGGFDGARVAAAYAGWLATGPGDAGGTTRAALGPAASALKAGRAPAEVAAAARAAASRDGEANGALMRVSPLGVLAHVAALDGAVRWAREDAALTHASATCGDASAVLVAAIAFAVRTGAPAAAVADEAERVATAIGATPQVRAALAGARGGRVPDAEGHPGHVVVALQAAFRALRHVPSLEEALVELVGLGGDTDTNAAIAGALLGAVHGVGAVPRRWRSAVLSCWPVEGAPGVARPRPPSCWAGDALILAERLVGAGWEVRGG